MDESGYTLVETVIAMALFVAVLLPITTSMANLFMDRTPEKMSEALHVAEKEMTEISLQKNFADGVNKIVDKFIVSRTIKRNEMVMDVEVIVALTQNHEKPVLILCKSILVY